MADLMFQFTHPGRGATSACAYSSMITSVSIHAPREGCDLRLRILVDDHQCFNSRTPGGVRLDLFEVYELGDNVSIHAPREGCDNASSADVLGDLRFNSRTPGGVRHFPIKKVNGFSWFQFTHPGRGATVQGEAVRLAKYVSIHAPREGCDRNERFRLMSSELFQFTHPGRGATRAISTRQEVPIVSIHAPREGCDPRSAFASGVLR